ncbi:hypothetical protein NDU88_007365 [Pleurodeles waltl]|uniref:CCHC-type domain-containing protein n=1 Tax=Pleurodeles waltl TaxID=8319 RepID=A0AAV7SS42_PLEWA|nr:hypothetical protein NDU88_007365 [Pleurodeles waltl]
MGASIDGEEDHGGDDEPPHPRPGHCIATLGIPHHCKWTQQGQSQRGIWNMTWQAIINLHNDPAGRDGLRHPPASFYLGADEGRIRYPGQPFTCRKCQAMGHKGMDCPEKYCRICRQTGHETSRCTGKKVCILCGGEGHTFYQCPKSDRPRTYAAAGTPAQNTTRPKLGPTANAKVNALLKASTKEAQKIPEPTRRSNPKGPVPQDHKSPGPDPEEEKRKPTVEPTTVTDPAPPTETTVSVEPTHPEGTPENGTPTNVPPLEAQGEPGLTPETGAEEGKESTAAARTPTPADAKSKKKNKHLRKKTDCSSGDEEEIEKAWIQVKSQRLREKCRKEKEERDERRWARTKGKQSPPQEEPQTEPLKDEEMERDEIVNQPPQKS